ncbi:MAG: tetratricopeptide repeat protein [Acidobacteriota bacterium]|nr:tetratricopeptide repeat protein [Acidobacteriota bacterium]
MLFRLTNYKFKIILLLQTSEVQQKLFSAFSLIILLFTISAAVFAQEAEETPNAVKIFNQGQDAHESGNFTLALKYYEEALKLAPEFPEAQFQRGNALLSIGKKVEAEMAFKQALELRSDWTLPMASLASLLIENDKFIDAEKILKKAIELNAQNFPAYVALTELRIRTKASAEELKQLLEKLKFLTSKANPTASVWAARGALERALGERGSAKTSLARALSLDTSNQHALFERAEIAFSEGDTATVSEIIKNLALTSPDSKNTKLLKARLYAESGKNEEAIKVLDSISTHTADIVLLRNNILDKTSSSVVDLEKRLEKQEKNAIVLGRLCALLRKDNPAKALEYCKRASESEPGNAAHVVGYGAALVQAKQYNDAVIILRRLLQVVPDNSTARANLATALFQIKKFEEAKIEYRWLTEKQPTLPIAYYFLAIIHDNLAEYMDAMANYQQFLKLADSGVSKLEIEKVNLRLPALQKLIKQGKGKKDK